MSAHLYFICPTDFIESAINESFKGAHYFVTSLGNSIAFDLNKIEEITSFIKSQQIKHITFILADNNQIVLDAWTNRRHSDIHGIGTFYNKVTQKQSSLQNFWSKSVFGSPILASHLNMKIKELKAQLNSDLLRTLHIDAKIFIRHLNAFSSLHCALYDVDHFCLN